MKRRKWSESSIYVTRWLLLIFNIWRRLPTVWRIGMFAGADLKLRWPYRTCWEGISKHCVFRIAFLLSFTPSLPLFFPFEWVSRCFSSLYVPLWMSVCRASRINGMCQWKLLAEIILWDESSLLAESCHAFKFHTERSIFFQELGTTSTETVWLASTRDIFHKLFDMFSDCSSYWDRSHPVAWTQDLGRHPCWRHVARTLRIQIV